MKKILYPIAGRRGFQKFFETLHALALYGMGAGSGGDFVRSGEKAALRRLDSLFRCRTPESEQLVLFDVGANIGGYAIALSDFFGERAVIHAFEPSRGAYEKLCSSVAARPGIVPHNLALGNESSTAVLYSDAEGSKLGSLYKRRLRHFSIEMERTQEVQVSTVDRFCEEHGIPRIDFLKLDVEGNELKVLEGASGMLASGGAGAIQFEFGGCNIDSRTYFQDFFYLLNESYQINRILRHGLRPIEKYRESHEIFLTTNFLAIHRDLLSRKMARGRAAE